MIVLFDSVYQIRIGRSTKTELQFLVRLLESTGVAELDLSQMQFDISIESSWMP
jgi:hypothetical protein